MKTTTEGAIRHYHHPVRVASLTLPCGHTVSADEESGGFDEQPRAAWGDLDRMVEWKAALHDCKKEATK